MSQNRPPSSNGRTPPTPASGARRNTPAGSTPPAGSPPPRTGPTPVTRPAGSPARTGRPGPPPAPKPAGTVQRVRPTTTTARPTAPGTAPRRAATPPRPPGLTGTLTTGLDRAGLARFSTTRYLAIWVPLLILFLGAILFLVYTGQNRALPLPKFMTVETTKGTFKIQLYSDPADSVQNVVRNFADKARGNTFNGRTFHRVEDWVIQGGDPQGNGSGGGKIPAQYNQKPFKRGAVGVASTAGGGPQINDSQWFVVKKDAEYLNGQYSNFGQVIEGMDVVDQIAIGDKMIKVTVADQ